MRSILVALSGLVAPGFAQGLMGQRRAMWIAIAAVWLPVMLVSLTIWTFAFAVVAWVGGLIDAGIRHRRLVRTGTPVRWEWLHPLLAFVCSIAIAVGVRVFIVEAFKMPSSSMYPTLQLGDHIFIEKLWRSYDHGEIIVFRQPCQPDRDYIKRIVAVAGDTIEVRCSVVYLNGKAVPEELVSAECAYDDIDDRDERWERKVCSRYRETLGSHTFETFHNFGRPLRDKLRANAPSTEIEQLTASLKRFAGDDPRALMHLENTSPGPDSKDFPDTFPRNCATSAYMDEGRPASNQPVGKIVTTREGTPADCKPYMHFVVPEYSVFVMGDNRDNSNDSRFWGVVPIENIKGHAQGIWLPLRRFGGIR